MDCARRSSWSSAPGRASSRMFASMEQQTVVVEFKAHKVTLAGMTRKDSSRSRCPGIPARVLYGALNSTTTVCCSCSRTCVTMPARAQDDQLARLAQSITHSTLTSHAQAHERSPGETASRSTSFLSRWCPVRAAASEEPQEAGRIEHGISPSTEEVVANPLQLRFRTRNPRTLSAALLAGDAVSAAIFRGRWWSGCERGWAGGRGRLRWRRSLSDSGFGRIEPPR